MRKFISIAFSFILNFSLNAQSSLVGEILTAEGNIIQMHELKTKKQFQKNKCDCKQSKNHKFSYHDEVGKRHYIMPKYVTKIFIKEGTRFCMEAESKLGDYEFMIYTRSELTLYGLKKDRRRRGYVLHSVIHESDDYMLTMYNSDTNIPYVCIFNKKDNSLVSGRHFYSTLGYFDNKKGLADILKYFPNSTEFLAIIQSNLEHNKKLDIFERRPILFDPNLPNPYVKSF